MGPTRQDSSISQTSPAGRAPPISQVEPSLPTPPIVRQMVIRPWGNLRGHVSKTCCPARVPAGASPDRTVRALPPSRAVGARTFRHRLLLFVKILPESSLAGPRRDTPRPRQPRVSGRQEGQTRGEGVPRGGGHESLAVILGGAPFGFEVHLVLHSTARGRSPPVRCLHPRPRPPVARVMCNRLTTFVRDQAVAPRPRRQQRDRDPGVAREAAVRAPLQSTTIPPCAPTRGTVLGRTAPACRRSRSHRAERGEG